MIKLFRKQQKKIIEDPKLKILNHDYGHVLTKDTNLPCDLTRSPLPWYTYPAIEYLVQFDFSNASVFEYGLGNSTLFWGERAKDVTSVEHNTEWFLKWKDNVPQNIDLIYSNCKEDYVASIMKNDAKYDLIVIDGIYRVSCSQIASNYLKKGGLIILDNSDWHTTAASILRTEGLLQVDMFGFGPINDYTWATSLFFDRNFAFKPTSEIQPKHGIGSLKHEDTIE